MKINSIRGRLLASTVICGASFAFAAPVFAQDAPVQEVVVTGSRIPQPNIASQSPITVVNNQEFKLEGTNDVIDALNEIPQTAGGAGNFGNNPNPLGASAGYTTVNLRGLGAVRTLVLIDGKRLMPGDPSFGAVAPDLDQIPEALVDHIEVVTGGASAVYGSDAIAGVVNFIMKKNFQGLELNAQYGFAEHDNNDPFMQGIEKSAGFPAPTGSVTDGQVWNIDLTLGLNTPDGKGNAEVYASYRHQDPVTEGTRDYSACLLKSNKTCSGSQTSNDITDLNGAGNSYSVVGTSLLPYPQAGSTPPAIFNSSPYEYLTREDERFTSGFIAHYDFSKELSVYTNFSFMDDRSTEIVAPGGIFYGESVPGSTTTGFTVPCNSPLLSAQEVTTLCTNDGLGPNDSANILIGRRNIEGGGRKFNYEHMSFRQVIGMQGTLGDVWHYDVSAQYGYTKLNTSALNYFGLSEFQSALNNGTYHLFSQGGVTAADLSSVSAYGTTSGDTLEQVVSANIGGDLGHYGIKSPFATEGVGVNFGTEYRRESLTFLADEELGSGDLAGGSGASPPVNAAFDVYELFGEARIPLVQDKPFVKDLNFAYGYRFSDYSSAGDVSALKYAAEYAPTSDIRFRGSFQRAVRAPNINELFIPTEVTQTSAPGVDPCAPIAATATTPLIPATATLAQCQNTAGTHITAAQIAALYGNGGTTDRIVQCPAGQCAYTYGGNAGLKPEVSDTTSFGVIFTPTFFKGFDLSIDYYNIDLKGAISSVPGTTSLTECLTSGILCNLVVRNAQGFLFGNSIPLGGFVTEANANIGYERTVGYDISSHYRINLRDLHLGDNGRLLFAFDGTYVDHFFYEPVPGLGNYDCAGLFGATCGLNPHFKSKLRATWQTPWKFDFSGQWRFTEGTKLDSNQSNPLLAGSYDAFDKTIPDISYFDLSVIWHIKDGYQLRAGCNNVWDKDPPLIAQAIVGSGNPNTFGSYDTLGRTLFVGIQADF